MKQFNNETMKAENKLTGLDKVLCLAIIMVVNTTVLLRFLPDDGSFYLNEKSPRFYRRQ